VRSEKDTKESVKRTRVLRGGSNRGLHSCAAKEGGERKEHWLLLVLNKCIKKQTFTFTSSIREGLGGKKKRRTFFFHPKEVRKSAADPLGKGEICRSIISLHAEKMGKFPIYCQKGPRSLLRTKILRK